MERLEDRAGMRDAISHRKTDLTGPAHIGRRAPDIAAIGHQLRGIGDHRGRIEEVVDPVRAISEKRFGPHFFPAVARNDTEDEGVQLDFAIIVNRAGRSGMGFAISKSSEKSRNSR
jgi:hypothetical protein